MLLAETITASLSCLLANTLPDRFCNIRPTHACNGSRSPPLYRNFERLRLMQQSVLVEPHHLIQFALAVRVKRSFSIPLKQLAQACILLISETEFGEGKNFIVRQLL